VFAKYAPRPIGFHGLETVGDHALKVYSIHYGDTPFDRSRFNRENELPTRVFVRADDGFRPAMRGESFCVWDLRLIWSEREAYVATALAGRDGGIEAYLAAVGLSEFA
jgi:hypothetical protein